MTTTTENTDFNSNFHSTDLDADADSLIDFILTIGSKLLSIEKNQLYKIIHDEKNQQVIQQFASESLIKILVISKNIADDDKYGINVSFRFEISQSDLVGHSIALIKRGNLASKGGSDLPTEAAELQSISSGTNEPFISSTSSHLASQIQVINLSYISNDSSPFAIANNYIQNCFLPIFNTYKTTIANKPQSDREAYSLLLKKLNELNLSLIQCQQRIEVPEIKLVFEPEIRNRVNKARAENRPPSVMDFEDKLDDEVFIANLIQSVTKWTQNIITITRMKYEINNGTTSQEINYWLSYERSLNIIDQQITLPEVEISIEILKKKKKFQITTTFENDLKSNIRNNLKKCVQCSSFMKEFPINELLSANSMQDISSAITTIFLHMKKIVSTETTIQQRALEILESISRDLNNQILKILLTYRLMQIPFPDFTSLVEKAVEIFFTWDTEYVAFKDLLRKTKTERMKECSFEHITLKFRLEKLTVIRRLHEKLREVIDGILLREAGKPRDAAFLTTKEIQEAYSIFFQMDVLDVSREGEIALSNAIKTYELKIDRVETHITVKLRDKLGSSSNANEMFRIFSKFNALFFRPHIRGAIQEYQSQLLKTVQKDIEALRDKFVRRFQNTETFKMSKVRDIPQTSGSAIWAKQLNGKLKKYMERVENVLGSQWAEHPEGKKLKEIGDMFEKHLNIQPIFDSWKEEILNFTKDMNMNHKIFDVQQKKKNQLEICVNFDERMISLFKELRNFIYMKIKPNTSLQFTADDAKSLYPFAVSLQESIHTFNQLQVKIDEKIVKLVASHRKEVLMVISQGFNFNWSLKSHLSHYVKRLSEKVSALEEAVQGLSEKTEQIQQILGSLGTCEQEYTAYLEKLNSIQAFIDDFNFKTYSNLHLWVPELDEKIETILAKRLTQLVQAWLDEFEGFNNRETKGKLIGEPSIHEIKIQDQVIYIDPPIEYARFYWFQQFHKQLGVICSLPRLEATRYENSNVGGKDQIRKDYSSILKKISGDVILNAYKRINSIISESESYVKTWLSYQALWEIDSKKVYSILEDNIEKWHQLLNEIKQGRSTFDNSETERYFGSVLIDYRLVQAKINNKYDAWHKEMLEHFGSTYNDKLKKFNATIAPARGKLEGMNFQSATIDITQILTDMQEYKSNFTIWENEMGKFRNAQKLLDRQRFQAPSDWLWLDQVEGEWTSFKQRFAKINSTMESEFPNLQARITGEERILDQKIFEIEEIWKNQRPFSGDMLPNQALDVLNLIDSRLQKIKENYFRVCKAKDLLNLEPGKPEKLEILEEDVKGLKEIWGELSKVWNVIDSMRDTPLNALVPKKIKQSLDDALEQINAFPTRLRSYEAFDKMKSKLAHYKKMNMLIIELKNEAMKPRHWKTLLHKIKLQVSLNDLTLGQLWNCDLLKYENPIKEILTVARGELVLEEMLRNIKEYWGAFEIELVSYQNKCRLIKGWDELFAKVDEDLNNLSSMKISPYYKSFEEEIAPWDDKLQKIRIIFDIWIDVQRRWVYLEGIFFGSSDIKQQLSNEYTRFKGIDSEFTSLMKRVSSKPLIMDVLSIPSLQKTLERLADLLAKIQKALGDYLEMQRSAFARFYFVGDEDLLEIIGNSKEVTNVQRHFTKMYAGITSLQSENGDVILGMNSREGENVPYETHIKISDNPTINVWLGKVDEQMSFSLATNLERTMKELATLEKHDENVLAIINKFPAQVVLLALQILWCNKIEAGLNDSKGSPSQQLEPVEQYIVAFLAMLAENVMKDVKKDLRQKFEQIITDFVHQRDVTRTLMKSNITSSKDFAWQYFMRFSWIIKESNVLKKLVIQMSNASFHYGFEYLGIGEKLVQTPLTDKCYLTLTQALHLRMGGNPFGPAGTGKTESVKALGAQLGRFVLVFNCDETFDFNAMGRIFIGLCQVGAWGCFDEFNRLEERMLSAVSQQILTIQTGLREKLTKIDLLGREVKLNSQMGIFVTMNPGYAGRSNLPENLKQLFRQMAMVKPDRELIAQVMLYSQGYRSAERLAGKIVSLFELCNDQLSSQPHYDFGLRALKSVLVSAGNMKRQEKSERKGDFANEQELLEFEQKILLRSVCETVVPKLIAEDIPLLSNLLSGVFPGSTIPPIKEEKLREAITRVCGLYNLQPTQIFMEKVLQLYQIQNLCHGVMMVGPSGCGKSAAWRVLLEAIYRCDKVKGESYIIDPKAITKDELYGRLDNTTLEWTDGVFTGVLRRITENVRGESSKRHWIIFDGDVDPEWAENLNSVLDDNKLLTLPNGERIVIPPNVRIMFEVETLKYATLATVSRCGMVWFSEEIVSSTMIYYHYLRRLRQEDYDQSGKENEDEENKTQSAKNQPQQQQQQKPEEIIRNKCVDFILKIFEGEENFVNKAISVASSMKHVMDFTRIRVLEALFALLRKCISNVIEYNETHGDFPLEDRVLEKYMKKSVLLAIMWGVGGSMKLAARGDFSRKLSAFCDIELPSLDQNSLIDYEVRIEDGEWALWKKKVPEIEIDPHKVTDADLIIPTVDTLRHQDVLCSWLSEHRPFLLCGPPGSGKTMTLMSTLKALPDFEMIFVNFSSSTNPSLILKQFDHYCEYSKTPNGVILRPKQPNKWLVVFCDEINLPEIDKYGTIPVITFLRQLTEQRGFWRPSDKSWISLERIQFVGACNPPTDAGRSPLSDRFLRHCPLILVDFPGPDSLKQIYGTFNRAMLKRNPTLRSYANSLTDAMVDFYQSSQNHFTADMQPHYIYSPRELTRWKYAINEAVEPLESLEDLVRLWAHEALRLFQDRLVHEEEKKWCDQLVDSMAMKHFPTCKPNALERPIYFTTYLHKNYVSVDREALREYVKARLKIFYEEELNVPIVVFDSVLDHILRIDRVLRQPIGHVLLVGSSGVGKTTLSRFVSWMNNLVVFQIKAGRNYSLGDFDNDLREVMKRAGVKQEKVTFIFDESNVLSNAFLERMNALLASGEIPGLFEGDEYLALMNQCKEAAMKDNKLIDSDDQLYWSFIKNVQRNLHVVFTMNPSNPDFSNRTASSPALFNRCVIDWFGDWSNDALCQVAKEFTMFIETSPESFTKHQLKENPDLRQETIVKTIVYVHNIVLELNKKLAKAAKKFNYLTPRDFLDFIKHYIELHKEKKESLEEQQYHLNQGLEKLKETSDNVLQLQKSLDKYKNELEIKEKEANAKLILMVAKQNEAETKKESSIKLSADLEKKQVEIKEKQKIVTSELEEALPALEKAKSSVNNIDEKKLVEIKSFQQPPVLVKLTLEAVASIITKQTKTWEWKDVKAIMNKDFINNVLNFNTDDLPQKVKDAILTNYVKKAEWDLDKIDRASKAAGPLAQWVDSQLKYADILKKVQPLRDSVSSLKAEEDDLVKQNDNLNRLIDDLQSRIKQYQDEYAILIAETQRLKDEMKKVLDKVTRSQALITNLSSERIRWEESSKNFRHQMATMPGDVLISAAFLSYIGFFDHFYRRVIINAWKDYLENCGLSFRQDLSLIEFLSKPSERLTWQSNSLPSDDLCTENAIILSKFHRYPLVIDPSSQALEFILNFYKDKKISRTSFSDDAFMKNLETALRFGCPLLVQDVEKIDPILNSVLNKEIHKTGGRVLIRVGDQEIDFAPSFIMFMITRDSNAKFTPDLCSRVTFVNFTVTPASLQNQCLNIYLRNERPETEEKRLNLLKLQGEYVVKLRDLEDSLLNALSNVKGNILENESVITTLETLKSESGKVTAQMADSNMVMEEVHRVTNMYLPLAEASSKIFFTLLSMNTIHYLYEFSLQYYMDTIFNLLGKNENLTKVPKSENEKRLGVIFDQLFIKVYERTCHAMLSSDKYIFALRLVQIKLGKGYEEAIVILLKNPSILESRISPDILNGKLNTFQIKLLDDISSRERYKNLVNDIEFNSSEWIEFLNSGAPEEKVPEKWLEQTFELKETSLGEKHSKVSKVLRELTILRVLRPDKFLAGATKLINSVLGDKFMEETPIDMNYVVEKESSSKSPILLCSAPGFDASFKVENLAKEQNKKLASVAIGSAEGFEQADKVINQGCKSGQWVLLKNVHLAPQWLSQLEKKIYGLSNINENFRLFLAMEFNPKVPSTLIRQSYKLVFEPPDGIKASLQRTYKTVLSSQRTDRAPVERSKLHFLLAWLHAVIQERLRYTPIGWTKTYEFNEADQRCSLDLIDEFVDNLGERTNIPPEKLPWDALKTILCQNLYGGKIDNDYDSKILISLVEQFFTPKSFDQKYPLFNTVGTDEPLYVPEGLKSYQYMEWIDKLPMTESPAWSGLPVSVEKILRSEASNRVISKLWELQDVTEEEISLEREKGQSDNKTNQEQQVQWLRVLGQRAGKYLEVLPANLERLARTANSITDPLFRFLEREITVASGLLDRIRSNMFDLKNMCEGKISATNDIKQLAIAIHSENIPVSWKKYNFMKMPVSEWIVDYKKRLEQFKKLAGSRDYQKKGVWIGGLLFPEAFLTATRQYVAQNHKWSLEELELKVSLNDGDEVDDDSFLVHGMNMEGAIWDQKSQQLKLTDEISSSVGNVLFKWIKVEKARHSLLDHDELFVPVYLNKSRSNLLFSIKMNCGSIPKTVLYQKGIALFAWNI